MSLCLTPRRMARFVVVSWTVLALAALASCSPAPPGGAPAAPLPPIASGDERTGSPANCAAMRGTYSASPVRVRLPFGGAVMLPGPGWCVVSKGADAPDFMALHAVVEPGAPAQPNAALSQAERQHTAVFSVRVFRAAEYFGTRPQTLDTLRDLVAKDAHALLAYQTQPRLGAPPFTVVAASAGEPIAGTLCVPERIEMEGPVAQSAPPVTATRVMTARYCINPAVSVVELGFTENFVKGDPGADRRGAAIRRLADEFFASLTFTAPPRTDAARD